MAKQQFTVLLNPEEALRIVKLGADTDRSMSSLIREAVKLYLMKKQGGD